MRKSVEAPLDLFPNLYSVNLETLLPRNVSAAAMLER